MSNRREKIKYQGLQEYRQRQQMRRMMGDGRNPYGSKGGYVVSNRQMQDGLMMEDMRAYQQGNYNGTLSDMTMQNQPIKHEPYMPKDYNSGMVYAGVPAFYEQNDMARRGGDYAQNQNSNMDMRGGYNSNYVSDMARGYGRANQGYDGHHLGMQGQGMTYYPIEAMGTFNGYYGMGQQDFARQGGRRDMGGDYGQSLNEKELDHWCKKLKEQLDEREKQMFSKEAISKHAKTIGRQMEGFTEKELEVATLMIYTDYKHSIGQNLDLAVRLAFDWLNDKDASVKGGEKLAVYYDCIIEGDDD
jgi:hypothetical protein